MLFLLATPCIIDKLLETKSAYAASGGAPGQDSDNNIHRPKNAIIQELDIAKSFKKIH